MSALAHCNPIELKTITEKKLIFAIFTFWVFTKLRIKFVSSNTAKKNFKMARRQQQQAEPAKKRRMRKSMKKRMMRKRK